MSGFDHIGTVHLGDVYAGTRCSDVCPTVYTANNQDLHHTSSHSFVRDNHIEVIRKLLQFQYKSLGYGKFACSSCGSLKYVDYGDQDVPMTENAEECSKNCPWRLAKEIINAQSSI